MATRSEWPAPAAEPVVVLLDAATSVERKVLPRWVRHSRPAETGADAVRCVDLPAPRDPDRDAAAGALRTALDDVRDPWLVPVREAWLPPDRDGERTVRMRDVLRNLGDPRHPNVARQRWLLRTEPDCCHVVVGTPARVSDLRERWATVGGDDAAPERFTRFVVRQATLTLERAETQLVGAQYKVPRLVREELLERRRFRSGLRRLAEELGRSEEDVEAEVASYLKEMVTGWSRLLVDLVVRLGRYNFRRGYDPELDFDPAQVARLREAAEQHPLVFLPSHKSNLDT